MNDLTPGPMTGTPYAPPEPGRPVRAVLMWLVVGLIIVACGSLSILAITSETGVQGLVTGLVLAAIPVFPVVGTFLWLDRYEAEPAHLLAFAFAWGAGVATFGALVVNTASVEAIRVSGGDPTAASVLVAPLVEEFFKGTAVLLVVLMRRREFDGVVDGIVYAGMAGIGFAFVENILYLGRTLGESGSTTTVFVFVLRCIVSPFAHPLFTSAIGAGLGVAVRTRNPLLRVLAPVGGYVVAVLLHAAWNLSASSGLRGFLSAYVVVQLPVFVLFGLIAVLARRREGRLIRRNLGVYASTGWLTPGEVGMLGSLAGRREARAWARTTGGPVAERAMREFQDLGAELAFLRERIVNGSAAPHARTQEYGILTSMAALRGAFLGRGQLQR